VEPRSTKPGHFAWADLWIRASLMGKRNFHGWLAGQGRDCVSGGPWVVPLGPARHSPKRAIKWPVRRELMLK
jgi:hypothetical protein